MHCIVLACSLFTLMINVQVKKLIIFCRLRQEMCMWFQFLTVSVRESFLLCIPCRSGRFDCGLAFLRSGKYGCCLVVSRSWRCSWDFILSRSQRCSYGLALSRPGRCGCGLAFLRSGRCKIIVLPKLLHCSL